jgi:hypothetical protein
MDSKEVGDETQSKQPPTTPIMTAPPEESFGSPQLEATNQTNVLLGALINEIQKLSSKFDGIVQQNSVSSTDDAVPKDQVESSDPSKSAAMLEELALKRLDSLNQRLKSLGY